MHTIDIAAYGWEFAAGFYPEGLPPEWRLAYYANEFDSVLVPAPLWCVDDEAPLAAWADEVDERFRFYWELPRCDLAAAQRLGGRLVPLLSHSGGMLLHGDSLGNNAELCGLPLFRVLSGAAAFDAASGVAIRAPAEVKALRGEMELLQHSGGQNGVVICDDLTTLRQALLVARLLGVSRSG